MMNRRDLLKGLGAAGLTAYLAPTALAKERVPFEGFIPLNVDNFDEEVLESEGVTVVVWYSNCGSDRVDKLVNNLDKAWQEIKSNYEGDVKFTAFQTCGEVYKSTVEEWQDKYGPGSTSLATHFYVDGIPKKVVKGSDEIDTLTENFSTKLDDLLE